MLQRKLSIQNSHFTGGAEVDALIANELAAAMNAYVDDYAFDTIMASTAVNQTQTADGALTAATVNAMEAAFWQMVETLQAAHTL